MIKRIQFVGPRERAVRSSTPRPATISPAEVSLGLGAEPVTAPRTSPLTEEEAHRRWHEAMGWTPPVSGFDYVGCGRGRCKRFVREALRVDSEARADLDEAVRLLRGAHCPSALVRSRAHGDWYRDRNALLARHPTSSTPTTGETEGA